MSFKYDKNWYDPTRNAVIKPVAKALDKGNNSGNKRDPNQTASTTGDNITVGSGNQATATRQNNAKQTVYTGGVGPAVTKAKDGDTKGAVVAAAPGGVINSANTDMTGKDVVGGMLDSMGNPLPSATTYKIPGVTAPTAVTAPAMPSGFGAVTVQGAPQTMFGAQIAAPGSPLTSAVIDTPSGSNSAAGYQGELAKQLALKASGQGPFVSDIQAAQARQQQQAALMAQMASQRGGANPLAGRTAMNASVAQNAQLNRDAMMAHLTEQNQAQSLLGTVSGQARGQDITQATSQAQLEQEVQLTRYKGELDRAVAQGSLDQRTAETMFTQAHEDARVNAQMGQAFNDSRIKFMQMGLDADKANQMAALEVERLRQSGALGQADLNIKSQAVANGMKAGELNALAAIGGTAATVMTGTPAAGAAVSSGISSASNGGGTTPTTQQQHTAEEPETGTTAYPQIT